jgi:hypothetical protein
MKKNLPEVYEATSVDEDRKVRKNGLIAWLKSNKLYGVILLILVGVSVTLFVQNKMVDKENQKMEEKVEVLKSKLDAAEKGRYERIEIETEQIMKKLSKASNLTTYIYEYTNKTTESSTRMLPILG